MEKEISDENKLKGHSLAHIVSPSLSLFYLMDSSKTRLVARRSDPANFPAKKNISSRRSLSSSSFLFPGDSPLNSLATPLGLIGVPFSWEQLPGKPKDYSHRLNHRRNNESSVILPLPPHRSITFPVTGKNHKSNCPTKRSSSPVTAMEKDPFAAALLECSKDDDEDEEDVDRRYRGNSGRPSKVLVNNSISGRFGLVSLYGSCRRTCAVSESIVYLPKPGKAASYDHLLLPRRHR
ncbi:uncharacterized protein LOC106421312 [Brassica napus]|uniref:Uncharacterized protein n=3 Tax=Brassica TaxID=3705 RepID=A0A8X7UK00_BRACI|nr:uncharacterized protein LOC106421312 [Brassica napus]KAG2281567.1 hypothetical protein Bca52824_052787 [Brassica carinata]